MPIQNSEQHWKISCLLKKITLFHIYLCIDYILAYEIDTTKDGEWQQKREEKRITFEQNLERANLELEAEGIEVHFILLIHNIFINLLIQLFSKLFLNS